MKKENVPCFLKTLNIKRKEKVYILQLEGKENIMEMYIFVFSRCQEMREYLYDRMMYFCQ